MGAYIVTHAGMKASTRCDHENGKDQYQGYDENQEKGEEYFDVKLAQLHGASTNIYPVPHTVLMDFIYLGNGFSFALNLLM